jgi:D-methionine transport system ATP-binding protein
MANMIQLQSVAQAYGAHEALRGIDLDVAPGEIFGMIGRSGAGKSSLVRTINLLNRPPSGKVIVGGKELTTLSESQLREARREIGLIFQHFNLLSSRTVAQNVALPLELAGVAQSDIKRRVDELLDLVGLAATAIPPRSAAARSSGWASPAPWPIAPRCCCPTRRPRRWTRRPRAPSSDC